MALQDIAWTVILLCGVGENPNPDNLFRAMVVTVVVGYLGYALFFHRIWMCVYKSLLQKSLGALDVWDFLSIRRLRTSNAISNLWVKQRHTLGNSLVMSVVWFIIWLLTGSLEMYYALSYGWYYPEDTYPAFDIINITIS